MTATGTPQGRSTKGSEGMTTTVAPELVEHSDFEKEQMRRQRVVARGKVIKTERVGSKTYEIVRTARDGYAIVCTEPRLIVRFGLPRQSAMGELGGAKARGRFS